VNDNLLAELAAIAATLTLFEPAPPTAEPPRARWALANRIDAPLDLLRRAPRANPWRIAGRLRRV
jgi:hypothetical protein